MVNLRRGDDISFEAGVKELDAGRLVGTAGFMDF
jgi:hypothetical protein